MIGQDLILFEQELRFHKDCIAAIERGLTKVAIEGLDSDFMIISIERGLIKSAIETLCENTIHACMDGSISIEQVKIVIAIGAFDM